MSASAASSFSLRNALRRFRRHGRGSAIVEFALVAPVFFALLFAIIEMAMVFFAQQVLESITQESARMVLTGQAQSANLVDGTAFKTKYVCNQISVLFTCANVFVDVQSYPNFSSITINSRIGSNGCFDGSNPQYSLGGPSNIVVVRLYYQWPLLVTGLGFNISNVCGSNRLLAATAAFQNEP
jgi:Flp pilus assembly protein TadG